LTVIPDQNSQITELNSNLIIDPANVEELKTGGWYFDSDSTSELGEIISGKYLFGVESSVDRKDMYLTIGNNDGTEPIIHNDVIVEVNASDNPSYDEAVKQATDFKERGGCLIATAAFGSEMAPQVQFLREIRDNTVLKTESGTAFMTSFNQFYYSFSPTIADYERENPVFKEAVKLTLTPLLTSLTLLQYADINSESEMLGYGISVIMLNIGMYFIVPALVIIKIKTIKKI
jgi:peptidyl-prolyl cis-trans isomerase B (cyclophilin B)